MSIKISYSNKSIKKISSNLVLFTNDKLEIKSLKKYLSTSEFSYINDLLKSIDIKKKIFLFELSSRKKIILI